MDVGHGEIYLYFKKMAFDLILYYDVKANNCKYLLKKFSSIYASESDKAAHSFQKII